NFKKMRHLILILTFCFSLSLSAHENKSVYDNGNFFSETEIAKLTKNCNEIKKKTSVDIVVYTIENLNGMDPVSYGLNLAREIHVGEPFINNGVLILLSKVDRKMQVLTGFGIEWIIPNEKTAEIVSNMIPYFKSSEYYNGVEKGIAMIHEKVIGLDWSIHERQLSNLSQQDESKIIKFKYDNSSNNKKFKYAIETDPQFSPEFKVELNTKQNVKYELYYTKYMNDLVNSILTVQEIEVYARLTDYENKKLELVGIRK
ncbi:MAG: TPM domain-containing protein, partial [Bacteroidales bacterium]